MGNKFDKQLIFPLCQWHNHLTALNAFVIRIHQQIIDLKNSRW
ncbi:Uncharacterised protein [Mycobacteroides abscessus subsp. abscessus]|nr:Uncharacterised protein [Mycobacteroides abscessus subsp. abscessus]